VLPYENKSAVSSVSLTPLFQRRQFPLHQKHNESGYGDSVDHVKTTGVTLHIVIISCRIWTEEFASWHKNLLDARLSGI
jgi:hypothetical protein